MSLSDRYKKQVNVIVERRAQLAYERAQAISEDVINSDQFALALESGLDNVSAAIDTILMKSCQAIFDPIADFMDTMRAKDLPEAFIRKYVHKQYDLITFSEESSNVPYEQMLEVVANYMCEHPEQYNGVKDLSGEAMREQVDG